MSYFVTFHNVYDGTRCILKNDKQQNGYGPICFAEYNQRAEYQVLKDDRYIEIYIKKDYSPFNCAYHTECAFNSKQIKLYLKDLNKCGFPFDFKEQKEQYVITLHEKNYKSKTHVRTALDFVRLLWEKDINKILKKYFNLSRQFILYHGSFEVLQALSMYYKEYDPLMTGHQLPSYSYGLISLETFLKEVPKSEQGSVEFWSSILNVPEYGKLNHKNVPLVKMIKRQIENTKVNKETKPKVSQEVKVNLIKLEPALV